MATQGIEAPSALKILTPANSSNAWVNRVFTSVAEANTEVLEGIRLRGLTCVIDTGSGLTEYWWKDGTTDADLVLKTVEAGVNEETDPTVPQYVKEISSDDILNWTRAFNSGISSGTITGDANKLLTLTREDGSVLQIAFTDLSGEAADGVVNTLNFDSSTGVLSATTTEGDTVTVNLDGRYALLNHTHTISNVTGLQTELDAKLTGTAATAADMTTGTSTTKFGSVKVVVDWVKGLFATAQNIIDGVADKIVTADKLKTAKDTISFFNTQAMADAEIGNRIMIYSNTGVAQKGVQVVEEDTVVSDGDITTPTLAASFNTTETVYANVIANYFCSDNNNTVAITPTNNKVFYAGTRFYQNGYLYECAETDNLVKRTAQGSGLTTSTITVLDTNTVSEQLIPLIGNNVTTITSLGISYNITEDSGAALDAYTVYYNREAGSITVNAAVAGDQIFYITYEK